MKDLYYKLSLDTECSDIEFWVGTIDFVPVNWRDFKIDIADMTTDSYNEFIEAVYKERDPNLYFPAEAFPGADCISWDSITKLCWEMNTHEEKPESIFDSRADINPNDLLQYLKGLGFNLIENAAEVDEFNTYHLELSNAHYHNYISRDDR